MWIPLAADIFGLSPWVAIAAVAIVLVVFMFTMVYISRYTKVGPNEVLIISGKKHTVTDPDGTRREQDREEHTGREV